MTRMGIWFAKKKGSSTMGSRLAKGAMMILVLTSFFIGCDAARHYVNWSPGADLQEWSQNSTFLPGDLLEFIYTNQYNVVEVGQLGYRVCDYTNPIALYNGSRTEIKLTQPGTRYFVSSLVEDCALSLEVEVQP